MLAVWLIGIVIALVLIGRDLYRNGTHDLEFKDYAGMAITVLAWPLVIPYIAVVFFFVAWSRQGY